MGELDVGERRALRARAWEATLAALWALGGAGGREAIRERALASGGFSERELAAPAPEAVAEHFARLVEHELSRALTRLRHEGLVENPAPGTWCLAAVARRGAALYR